MRKIVVVAVFGVALLGIGAVSAIFAMTDAPRAASPSPGPGAESGRHPTEATPSSAPAPAMATAGSDPTPAAPASAIGPTPELSVPPQAAADDEGPAPQRRPRPRVRSSEQRQDSRNVSSEHRPAVRRELSRPVRD